MTPSTDAVADPDAADARILIVDDEEQNLLLLEFLLADAGYRNLHHTTRPREVSALCRASPPDLILLDLNMPGLDGFGVMDALRDEAPADRFLPILVLTADVSTETRRRALAGGAHDFLSKPFDVDEVILRCRNLLRTRALHVALQAHNDALELRVAERTKRLEEALDELQANQEQQIQTARLRALGEMASGVAHDFNNQLTILSGFNELLLANDGRLLADRSRTVQYLRRMGLAAGDAAQVVSRLREFSRPRGVGADTHQAVDLREVAVHAADLTQPRWKEQALAQGRHIELQVDAGETPLVLGHPEELREAVTNLIFNAVDALPTGGTITLRTGYRSGSPGEAELEVSDTGLGMDEATRQRCLDPFFSTKGLGGSGLGLPMVYGIVERHGGQLIVRSEPGRGASFLIRLPISVGFVRAQPAAVTPPREADELALAVLLVEDNASVRDVVGEYLRSEHHVVTVAADGREGLEKFRAGRFDVVVTDLAMAGMNGEELACAVKAEANPAPVVLLSGFGAGLLAEGRTVPGVDLIVGKPVSAVALQGALRRVIRARPPGSAPRSTGAATLGPRGGLPHFAKPPVEATLTGDDRAAAR